MNFATTSAASYLSAHTAVSFQAQPSAENQAVASPLDKVALNPQPLPPKIAELFSNLGFNSGASCDYDDIPYCGNGRFPGPHPPVLNLGQELRFE